MLEPDEEKIFINRLDEQRNRYFPLTSNNVGAVVRKQEKKPLPPSRHRSIYQASDYASARSHHDIFTYLLHRNCLPPPSSPHYVLSPVPSSSKMRRASTLWLRQWVGANFAEKPSFTFTNSDGCFLLCKDTLLVSDASRYIRYTHTVGHRTATQTLVHCLSSQLVCRNDTLAFVARNGSQCTVDLLTLDDAAPAGSFPVSGVHHVWAMACKRVGDSALLLLATDNAVRIIEVSITDAAVKSVKTIKTKSTPLALQFVGPGFLVGLRSGALALAQLSPKPSKLTTLLDAGSAITNICVDERRDLVIVSGLGTLLRCFGLRELLASRPGSVLALTTFYGYSNDHTLVHGMAVHARLALLAVASDDGVYVWDLQTGLKLATLAPAAVQLEWGSNGLYGMTSDGLIVWENRELLFG